MTTTDAYQEAVNKLMNYVDQTVNFAKGELPEICKEILAYGAIQNYFWKLFTGCFAVLAFLVFIISIISCIKAGEVSGVVFFAFLLFLAVSALWGCNLMEGKKIELAPKLYVMEYLRSEIKSDTK